MEVPLPCTNRSGLLCPCDFARAEADRQPDLGVEKHEDVVLVGGVDEPGLGGINLEALVLVVTPARKTSCGKLQPAINNPVG